jgi:non-heme chloroperoxidase
LEDDLVDLIDRIRADMPKAQIILAGHSRGAGLLIRFAGGRHLTAVHAYVALWPCLGHFAPTNPRRSASGWARIRLVRLAIDAAANKLGPSHWGGSPVMEFAPPSSVHDDEETFAYSFRLLVSISPRLNYRRDLTAIAQPLLVAVGEADELFRAEAFVSEIARTKSGRVQVIPGATHLGVVFDPRVHHLIGDWLEEFAKDYRRFGR